MTRLAYFAVSLALTVALASTAMAQNQATAGPPVRRIATASAVSTEQIGNITSVRELPGGRVLMNDGGRRRLVLMDTALKTIEVVLDSLTEVENSYGTRPGALIPFRGDSTLFIDVASYAMLVIDPSGKVARVRSVPRVEDANRFGGGDASSRVGIDGRGRIVYRIQARPGRPLVPPPRGVPYFPPEPDSAFIVGIDLDTRKIDTLGTIRIPKSASTVRRTPTGGLNFDEVVLAHAWAEAELELVSRERLAAKATGLDRLMAQARAWRQRRRTLALRAQVEACQARPGAGPETPLAAAS